MGPFGADANDIDGKGMHSEFNHHLLLLCKQSTRRIPVLSEDCLDLMGESAFDKSGAMFLGSDESFSDVWADLAFDNTMGKRITKRFNFMNQSENSVPTRSRFLDFLLS